MNEINDGGPVFPGPDQTECTVDIHEGMTLRDYFAAKAMQATLSSITEFPDETWRIGVALDAYLMADAMLIARGESNVRE